MNRKTLLLATLLATLGGFAQADGSVNFWNRMVWKIAQVYPLDSEVYTGWGPDWAGPGVFNQMTLGFAQGPVGFALDTQYTGAADLVLHVNYVQGWMTLVPDTLKVYAGKIRLDDYRWTTEYTDRGMGRLQVPDNWGAAAATYTLKGTSLKATVLVPAFVGTTSPSVLQAKTTGPNKPTNPRLADSLALADAALSYDDKGTGLRFVAATIGDTSAGGAYGSTGSDLGSGFGEVDPNDSSRGWYGGLGWSGPGGLSLWSAATWWTDPASAAVRNQHAEVTAQAQWIQGDLKVGIDGVVDWHQGAPGTDLVQTQVVSGLTTGSYTVPRGPLTATGYLGGSYKVKAGGLELVPALAVGGGNRDLSTGMGTYTFPTFDRFLEVRSSLLWNPSGLTLGFSYKYDLDARVSTWVVPVTMTFSSY